MLLIVSASPVFGMHVVINPPGQSSVDSDGDRWSNSAEYDIGTAVFDKCPDAVWDDTWPPDVGSFHDGIVSVGDIGAEVVAFGRSGYPRYDINASGGAISVGDIGAVIHAYGVSVC